MICCVLVSFAGERCASWRRSAQQSLCCGYSRCERSLPAPAGPDQAIWGGLSGSFQGGAEHEGQGSAGLGDGLDKGPAGPEAQHGQPAPEAEAQRRHKIQGHPDRYPSRQGKAVANPGRVCADGWPVGWELCCCHQPDEPCATEAGDARVVRCVCVHAWLVRDKIFCCPGHCEGYGGDRERWVRVCLRFHTHCGNALQVHLPRVMDLLQPHVRDYQRRGCKNCARVSPKACFQEGCGRMHVPAAAL
mmetsp:Transcript_3596/g.8583  ORF Transcript_3596/g.8583 Transcript_3596/m.8583 type:complete len:246 (-) Transcript_3596:1298-2035(-)